MNRATLVQADAIALELERRKNGRWWGGHKPHAKQRAFLDLQCLESLYGGAAGGGKSDAELMAALQYFDVPGYAAIIFRRTYTDLALPGAIMDRAGEWLRPTPAHWSEKSKTWTSPAGATLTFSYLDNANDIYRYQSAEFQFIGFDELTQFPERWYRYLFSRLRRPAGMPVPLRMRGATNPGGIGHEWVRRRFAIPDEIDYAKVYETAGGRRVFVPARLEDNPSLDADAYEESLAELDATTREQLRFGRWKRDAGGLVYSGFNLTRNVIDEAPKLDFHILAQDYGYTDALGNSILGWREHDPLVYVVRSFKRRKMIPSASAELAQTLEAEYKFCRIVGDIGGLGKGYSEEARQRFSVPIEPADKNNKRGYISLINGDFERRRLVLVRSGCEDLIAEYLELPWNADHSKEVDGFDNHCCDATLYGWRACVAYGEKPRDDEPEPGTPEWEKAEEQRAIDDADDDAALEYWER